MSSSSLTATLCDLCSTVTSDPVLEKKGATYLRCRTCGLIYTDRRQLSTVDVNDDYFASTVAKYVSKCYTEHKQRRYAAKLELFKSYRQLNRVLEVGANVGGFIYQARRQGWEAIGVEPVEACAEYGRKTHDLDVRTTLLEDAEFPADSFDGMFSNAVFEHLPYPSRVFAEVARVLRPGGMAFIDTVNWDSYTRRFIGSDWKLVDPTVHLCLYSPKTLRKYCENSGLEVLKITTHGVRLRGNHRPRLTGVARWSEELVKLPLSVACRATLKGDSIAVIARKPG